ncbi:glycoside hydrolase family 18 protein [Coniophora puteana RWD-64-598 SS2]|uniref:chitinase n=1 Tax=Coniophora puteana (strain RWD-64-598) TaxID=741705 RepID=R7SES9_CONPW|nr:glycoside hydrolase family 18 protein [Coniophora puteana RWD-64-598 SS2]EIW74227.1 glycoside hydrolase family 18 protein [Coniophora puteana RWD-64-598 SS2]
MVHFRSSALAVAAAVFSLIGSAAASPLPLEERLNNFLAARKSPVAKRATVPDAPHFVVYSDKYSSTEPAIADINGFNVFALAFLEQYGAADDAQVWAAFTDDQRKQIVDSYHAAGISLIVSAFGSTENPTSSSYDPVATADTIAAWVTKYGVDGVDVDYEDFTAFNKGDGSAETWLINFTKELRAKLPQGQYILTHAPVAPWFSPAPKWGGGGYLKVNQEVGDMIDWYNVQFYNQGTSEYADCDGLLTKSTSAWPQSSLFEIVASGVDQDKLVIGKPGTATDANNGVIAPATLATCVSQAHAKGWNAGVMSWQYPDAGSAWITTVRGDTWPVAPAPSGSASSTSASATSSAPASTASAAPAPFPTA